MMDKQEILASWTNSSGGFGQVEVWDEAAAGYAERAIPTFEDDPFLRMMADQAALSPDMTVLDIGCGAGLYSIAIAPLVRKVVGCDISPKMIEAARAKAAEVAAMRAEGSAAEVPAACTKLTEVSESCSTGAHATNAHPAPTTNTEFICGDFADLTFDEPFDVVFAHFTPALGSGAAFEKMMSLAKRWCFVATPTRRTDPVLEECRELAGIAPTTDARDQNLLNTFALAWLSGKTPTVQHYEDVWLDERTLEDAQHIYSEHLVATDLSPDQKRIVRDYLAKIARDGKVFERIETTVVMLGWEM